MTVTGTAQLANAQAPEKKVKDQGEYDIFNQTLKDANAAEQIKDLDTWTQKYPESDYKDDRFLYYLQAYNAAKMPAKVLEVGSALMARDLSVFMKDPKAGPQQVLQVKLHHLRRTSQAWPTRHPNRSSRAPKPRRR